MNLTFKERKKVDEYQVEIPYYDFIEINKTLGSDSYVLYHYLHTRGSKWKWVTCNMAKELGWSERKIQEYKRKLKDAGWIDYWRSKGNSYLYLGKEMVRQSIKERIEEGVDDEK